MRPPNIQHIETSLATDGSLLPDARIEDKFDLYASGRHRQLARLAILAYTQAVVETHRTQCFFNSFRRIKAASATISSQMISLSSLAHKSGFSRMLYSFSCFFSLFYFSINRG